MQIEVILDSLRAQGYRITKAREDIIRVLCLGGHFNIEQIGVALKQIKDDVNVATIYNNIRFLVDEHIVTEFAFNGRNSVYELNIGLHAHLICKSCGHIENVDLPGLNHLQEVVEDNTGFKVEENKLEFYGCCKSCLVKKG